MPILIRDNTFETNSSSCHSLTISTTATYFKEPITSKIVIDKFEYLAYQDGQSYSDFIGKLTFLLLYIRDNILTYDYELKDPYDWEKGCNYFDIYTVDAIAAYYMIESAIETVIGEKPQIIWFDIPYIEFLDRVEDFLPMLDNFGDQGYFIGGLDEIYTDVDDKISDIFTNTDTMINFLFNTKSSVSSRSY